MRGAADADLVGSEAWKFLLTRLMRGAAAKFSMIYTKFCYTHTRGGHFQL